MTLRHAFDQFSRVGSSPPLDWPNLSSPFYRALTRLPNHNDLIFPIRKDMPAADLSILVKKFIKNSVNKNRCNLFHIRYALFTYLMLPARERRVNDFPLLFSTYCSVILPSSKGTSAYRPCASPRHVELRRWGRYSRTCSTLHGCLSVGGVGYLSRP